MREARRQKSVPKRKPPSEARNKPVKGLVEIERLSKTRQEFRDIDYIKLGLPMAPAVMVGDELIVQGCDAAEEKVEAAICGQLNSARLVPKSL